MRLLAICRGKVAALQVDEDQSVMSGIHKQVVSSLEEPTPICVLPLGIEGDEQADLTVHGGLDKAVYAYPQEHYVFWSNLRTQALKPVVEPVAGLIPYADLPPLPPGSLGENLLVTGLNERNLWIGDILRIGEMSFIVSGARHPCYKFNAKMGFNHAVKMMVQSGYCGFYLQVMQPGKIKAGDEITLEPGERYVTVREQFALRYPSRLHDLR